MLVALNNDPLDYWFVTYRKDAMHDTVNLPARTSVLGLRGRASMLGTGPSRHSCINSLNNTTRRSQNIWRRVSAHCRRTCSASSKTI